VNTDKHKWQYTAATCIKCARKAYKKVLLDVILASPVDNGEEDADDVQPAVARPFRPGPAAHQATTALNACCDQYRVNQDDGKLDTISESHDRPAAICRNPTD